VYRVSATLNHNLVSAYGQSFPLRPGMTLSADIQLDQRTVIEWLFEPLLSIKGNL
jgi:membrane fusion protein